MKQKVFAEIRLIPTLFYLDIWINWKSKKELATKFSQRYDFTYKETFDDLSASECSFVETDLVSPLKGQKRIVLVISDFKVDTLVHELVHVFYHLDHVCNLGSGYKNQEWIAYFQEYIFTEVMNKIK